MAKTSLTASTAALRETCAVSFATTSGNLTLLTVGTVTLVNQNKEGGNDPNNGGNNGNNERNN